MKRFDQRFDQPVNQGEYDPNCEGVMSAPKTIEDNFTYMEPPRVYQPVRQCLGYVLASSGRLQEAEQVWHLFPEWNLGKPVTFRIWNHSSASRPGGHWA